MTLVPVTTQNPYSFHYKSNCKRTIPSDRFVKVLYSSRKGSDQPFCLGPNVACPSSPYPEYALVVHRSYIIQPQTFNGMSDKIIVAWNEQHNLFIVV